jgi:hypothetical protein
MFRGARKTGNSDSGGDACETGSTGRDRGGGGDAKVRERRKLERERGATLASRVRLDTEPGDFIALTSRHNTLNSLSKLLLVSVQ